MNEFFRRRPATLADWPGIAALDQEIFGAYGAQEEPAIIRSRLLTFPQGCAALEGDDSDGRRFIAGYLTTEKWTELREPALDEEPQESHQADGRVLNITTLAVAPACQNQGLGARLLDHAIAVAQQEGCRQIILETAHAERFYLRHRFRRIGERTERGIRMAIMLLELTDSES